MDVKQLRKEYLEELETKNLKHTLETLARWTIEHGEIQYPIVNHRITIFSRFDVELSVTSANSVIESLRKQGFKVEVKTRNRIFRRPSVYLSVAVE